MRTVETMVIESFIAEASALKPGNVHPYAPGHDMAFEDFERSARLSAPILCEPQLGVGERIYLAMEQVIQAVGCNTNLGMLLLFTPLVAAYQRLGMPQPDSKTMRLALAEELKGLSQQDTDYIYRAIRLAEPGGLGDSEQYDVREAPAIGILEAMQHARHRDRIALQYVTDFEDIFEFGQLWIQQGLERWNDLDWTIVLCYLNLLCRYPDSHIARKFGEKCAERVRQQSIKIADQFNQVADPSSMKSDLLRFDSELKAAGINPGTTADITAASILVSFFTNEKILAIGS